MLVKKTSVFLVLVIATLMLSGMVNITVTKGSGSGVLYLELEKDKLPSEFHVLLDGTPVSFWHETFKNGKVGIWVKGKFGEGSVIEIVEGKGLEDPKGVFEYFFDPKDSLRDFEFYRINERPWIKELKKSPCAFYGVEKGILYISGAGSGSGLCGGLMLKNSFPKDRVFYVKARLDGIASINLSELGAGKFGIFRVPALPPSPATGMFVGSYSRPLVGMAFGKTQLVGKEYEDWMDIFMSYGKVVVNGKSFDVPVMGGISRLILGFDVGKAGKVEIARIAVFKPVNCSYKIEYQR